MNGNGVLGTRLPFIIKICGITREEDLHSAAEAGANAVGINLWPRSARYVSPDRAKQLLEAAPEGILRVGVVVADGSLDEKSVASLSFDVVQVHGVGEAAAVPALGHSVWVAVAPDDAGRFPFHPLVIDSSWGSGRRIDWKLLRSLTRDYLLSGGLDGDCVAEAVRTLRPAGVDVCTGVERAPGLKDVEKMKQFVCAARQARVALPSAGTGE